jgi:adenine-specific DNA-methyltransferase
MIQLLSFDELDLPIIESDVTELAKSIQDKGLLHPITVQKMNGKYKIIAGFKRAWAVKINGTPAIECKIIETELDALGAEELNLHENLKRANLPWYEEVQMTKRLHEVMQKKFGASNAKGGRKKKGSWSIRDTAKELGKAMGGVVEAVMLAKAIEQDSRLKNVKDKTTALKMARNFKKRYEQESEAGNTIASLNEIDSIYCANSVYFLKGYPDNCFDGCLTDPPWLKFNDRKEYIKDDETDLVFKEIFRVLKNDSFLVLFVGIDDWVYYKSFLSACGFKVQSYPLIWVKKNIVSMGTRAWEFHRDFEFLTVAVKGSPALLNSGVNSSILDFAPIPSVKLVHPNEKPTSVLEHLLRLISSSGALILDPFAGSGSTLQACKNTCRKFIGIERNPDIFYPTKKRLGL